MAAVAGCMVVSAAVPTIKEDGEGKYTIEVKGVSMTVDAQNGGKILSYKSGEREIISQLKWREAFGSTFWTSPQKEWNWPPVPEYDKRPYTVEQKKDRLVLTSEVSPRLGYRITKTFTTDKRDGAIVVTYGIKNETDKVQQVAPWEITRVTNGEGIIFFDAPVDAITPAGLMDFKEQHGVAWYQPDVTNQNRKVNADGKGWLAYCANGLLMVKTFQDLDASEPAPGEAEIQVYVNQGKAHIELESQGAYTTLQPGDALSWTVRWYLQPYKGTPEPSEALFGKVRKLIGR